MYVSLRMSDTHGSDAVARLCSCSSCRRCLRSLTRPRPPRLLQCANCQTPSLPGSKSTQFTCGWYLSHCAGTETLAAMCQKSSPTFSGRMSSSACVSLVYVRIVCNLYAVCMTVDGCGSLHCSCFCLTADHLQRHHQLELERIRLAILRRSCCNG